MSIILARTTENIDWNEACVVFERAPLGMREPDKLRRAFENSALVRFAWDQDRLVGFGRALSDGVYQAAIYDVCVLPEYQGTGLGRRIMESLMAECDGLTVVLYSVPEKIGFYGRLGFEVLATGMGRFRDRERMRSLGYVADTNQES